MAGATRREAGSASLNKRLLPPARSPQLGENFLVVATINMMVSESTHGAGSRRAGAIDPGLIIQEDAKIDGNATGR